jgi:hypothetical protein
VNDVVPEGVYVVPEDDKEEEIKSFQPHQAE